MSKRRQDGNLRDVTESDNCVPVFTSARSFAARISFLFGTRIAISHAASFFTRLICKLFMAGSAKPHHKCLLRPAPVGNAVLCVRIAARTKETRHWRHRSEKKLNKIQNTAFRVCHCLSLYR